MTNPLAPTCCRDPLLCCSSSPLRPLILEYLHLDQSLCQRCQQTWVSLQQALRAIEPTLTILGYVPVVRSIPISSPELAIRYALISSPTIRVNGTDLIETLTEDSCSQCSELCGDLVNCRTFTVHGISYAYMPVSMILESLMRYLVTPTLRPQQTPYVLPDNLKRFFNGRSKSTSPMD